MIIRSKPIEAIRWGIDSNGKTVFSEPTPAWLAEAMAREPESMGSIWRNGDWLVINTDDGTYSLDPGDYILRMADGTLCGLDHETFWQWYEVVEVRRDG